MENVTVVGNKTNTETKTPSKWLFWLAWLVANALGFSLANLLALYSQDLVNTYLSGMSPFVANLVNLALAVLPAVIVAVAQWLVLRKWLEEAHWWLAATALGWILLTLVTSTEITYFESGARNQNPLLFNYINLLSFVGYGLVFGLLQWLVLRLERPRSSRWIGWITLGTAVSTILIFLPIRILESISSPDPAITQFLTALSNMNPLEQWLFRLIQWGLVAAVSGVGLFQILSRPADPREIRTQASPWHPFLLYWSLGTLVAIFLNYRFAPNFLSFWPAVQSDPNLRALAVNVFMGAMVGVFQWLPLRGYFKNAYLWILATILGYALIGINQNLLPILYPDTSFLNMQSFGDVLRSVTYFLAGSLGFWVVLGVFQAGVLLYWLGRKAWIWVLAVPAIQIVGLLVNMILWVPIGQVVQAVGTGLWLIYIIRSGLLEEVYFAPQAEIAPSEDELETATLILQDRMATSWAIQGQAAVDGGRLRVEVANHDDANDVTDLALQQGKAAFFKVDADASLEDGSRLPEEAKIILNEEDVETAASFEPSAGEQPGFEIKLTSEGKQKLDQAWKEAQPLRLGLALDGEVVAEMNVEALDEEGVYEINPFSLDTNFLAAILDNDPLPFPLKAAEAQEIEEEGTAQTSESTP